MHMPRMVQWALPRERDTGKLLCIEHLLYAKHRAFVGFIFNPPNHPARWVSLFPFKDKKRKSQKG